MIVIVLCGGIGSRMEDYSFPKPLNMIYGKPSIFYCLQNLDESVKTIYFIVGPHLQKFNFREIVTNQFKTKTCIFYDLPYFTRGPIETAFLGTQLIDSGDQNILFLDNDVMYDFPNDMFQDKDTPFIGYSIDKTNNDKYSFLKLNNSDNVIEFKEKIRISNLFCCGVYGFQNMSQFNKYAARRVCSLTSSELYMSLLFQDMMNDDIVIKGICISEDIHHIGSLAELKKSLPYIPKPQMRICFDLDNTLVTYPTVPNDYASVKPITNMITLVNKLHAEGHVIIIYTARRMGTHKHNIGSVVKDIGLITLQTLTDFGIQYDEIIFGKPIADMYIDDRSINPYRNDMYCMGYMFDKDPERPLNSLPPNKYNTIEVSHGKIIKTGPAEFIDGEIFYYTQIPIELSVFFPTYFESSSSSNVRTLTIEHIHGIPAFTLYKSGLLTTEHIDMFLEFLDILHSLHNSSQIVTKDKVCKNYIDKLITRFNINSNYPFIDATSIQTLCLSKLHVYISKNIDIAGYIHGDFWFSNIIIDFKGKMKTIDMKGKVFDTFTCSGDKLYDYGKLYQSILGFDCALNGVKKPENHLLLQSYFEEALKSKSVDIDDLKTVTFSLVIGALHFIEDLLVKKRVWEWIKEMFIT